MPPKKADNKKKGDKNDKGEEDAQAVERELVEKELALGYLKSKLGRYQDHGEKLQVDNIRLNEELESQKLNLKDINEFLTNELKSRSLTNSAFETRVNELTLLLEEVKKSHEAGLGRMRAEKDHEIDSLQSTVREFERRARSTAEFLERKDALEAELAEAREALTRRVQEYEHKLTDMDRQHIQDREKSKRELAQRIKETKLQMMKLTDNQLEMTTKRTIMENEQMSIELSYQSRQTEKLLTKNQRLIDENSDLRRQLELSKQTEEELAKRNTVYQKTIKSLLTKLKDQGWQTQENDLLVGELESRINDLESQLHLAELQAEERAFESTTARNALADRAAEADALQAQYDDTAAFLLQCMEDVREKIVTVVSTEEEGGDDGGQAGSSGVDGPEIAVLPGRLDELSPIQRERVLAFLLEKLHVRTSGRPLMLMNDGMSGGGGGAGGGTAPRMAGDTNVFLPPIPAIPRRTHTSSTPLAPLSADAGMGTMSKTRMQTTMAAEIAQDMPSVDDLLSKVMSDVRPWGKRSSDKPLGQTKGGGGYLRRGTAGGSFK